MPRELTFISPSIDDLIGRTTIGAPRKVRKKSRTRGLPRLKLENGYYIAQPDRGDGLLRWLKKWSLPVIGGLAGAMLVFSAGARYEWRQSRPMTGFDRQSKTVADQASSRARFVRGPILKPDEKIPRGLATPKPVGTIPTAAASQSKQSLPSPPPDKASSAPAHPPSAINMPRQTHQDASGAQTLASPTESAASTAVSIPPIPSVLVAQGALMPGSVPYKPRPALDEHAGGTPAATRNAGVHVSLLSGRHEQPPLNLVQPSGVRVVLLPKPSSNASATSPQSHGEANATKSDWRVVTVLGHGVVVQRDGGPMQMIQVGGDLPDGSILSSVNPGAGQWEAARPSTQPTKPTKDVNHGIATNKSQ